MMGLRSARAPAPPGSVADVDRWRLPEPDAWSGRPAWEWHHFILFGDDGITLLNLSRELRADGSVHGRVMLLRHGEGWTTLVKSYERLVFPRHGRFAAIGPHELTLEPEGWQLDLGDPALGLEGSLRLRPKTAGLLARNRALGAGAHFHWASYPVLAVDGTLWVQGRRLVLDGSIAYHDHNWGAFAWGEDFGWEWCVIPPTAEVSMAVLCSSLTNRPRSVTRLQQVFVWTDDVHRWTARGSEIEHRAGGRWPPGAPTRVPAALSLVTPPLAGLPPRQVRVSACDAPHQVDINIELEDRCQVLIPSQVDLLGAMVLNECVGTARVAYTRGDEHLELVGPCVFEFLQGDGRAG